MKKTKYQINKFIYKYLYFIYICKQMKNNNDKGKLF